MKLAVFTNRFPGKISTFFARDLRALIEAGAEPEVFPIYPGDQRLWRFVPSILADVLPRDRVHHLASLGGLRASAALPGPAMRLLARETPRFAVTAARYGAAPLAKTLFVLPIAAAWAARHAHRFDHVLAYWGNYAGTCAYLAHRLAGRDIPFSIYLHAGTDLFRTQVLLDEKLRYADRIVTECEFNRRFIADLYPDLFPSIAPRIQVNLMGLDLAEFPYRPEGRAPHRVLGVGWLAEAKGYHVLLRALGHLAREGVPFELELVGDGEEAGRLRALARSLGIVDRVRFRGWLHFDDVRRAMLEATLFVHPSTRLGDAKPNVIQEAMALGTPVVASAVAGIPELLDQGRCGVLVPPRDDAALAAAIRGLLQDPARRLALAAAGRRHVERRLDLWRNGRRLMDHLASARRGTCL